MDSVDALAVSRPAIILARMERGGAERVALDLARGLQERGASPLLVALGGGEWLTNAADGVDTRSGLWTSGWDYRVVRRLADLLVAEGVSSAIVFGRDACGFWGRMACSRVGIPVVQALHMGRFRITTHPKRVAWHWVNRVLDAATSAFVCVSADQADFMVSSGLPENRIVVIPNGVEARSSGVSAEEARVARSRMGVEGGSRLLCMVSRFAVEKRQDLLLRAFASIGSRFRDARLVFIGDGPTRHRTERLCEALHMTETVAFMGSRDDVGALLPGVDVLVHATDTESFGVVVLEAMSAGIPVVATRCGGLPEIVVDGETGLLVTPGSVEALNGAVARLLEDPELAASMGAAGRVRADACFSVDQMANAYVRLLARLK